MEKLIVKSGEQTGTVFALEGEEIAIGRSHTCEIELQDTDISRRHTVLKRSGDSWVIEDLQSANGVRVNGSPITRVALKNQDEIKLGKITLKFLHGPDADAVEAGAPAGGDTALHETETRVAPLTSRHASPRLAGKEDVRVIENVGKARADILREIRKVIIGQEQVLEEMLIALFSRGHSLVVGVPGLAKTLMVSTIARVLDLDFKRIQFTPDLMPADITGTDVLEEDSATRKRSFKFIKGPVFTNVLLADEINRTPPKTQAALLEAMQERMVTAGGYSHKLPSPFFVLATQNPIEQEGTYPLPEAQLDRFMFNVLISYPKKAEEVAIVKATTVDADEEPEVVLTAEDIMRLQTLVRRVPVSEHVIGYATNLARATRPGTAEAPAFVNDWVTWGAGPRAAQYMVIGAKARAILAGRYNVSSADVKAVAPPVMRHRIFLNFNAESEGLTVEDVIKKLLTEIPEPSERDYRD
jgi:MoxR-like ATPase